MAIDEDGVIVGVGSEAQVLSRYSINASYDYVDLKQRLVLPGFQDSHLHAVEAGINAGLCYISEFSWLEDIPFALDDCPRRGLFADQGWIVGAGIDIGHVYELLEDNRQDYPITVLGRAYPNTPVLILDNLGHGAIANRRAFDIVGFSTLRGDPPGGIIDRDPLTSEPTGIVLENAQQVFRDAAFPPTAANERLAYDSLLDALDIFATNGITTVSDAGGFWRQAQTESWAKAESDGLLTVRASNALYVYPDIPIDEQLPELTKRFANDPDALLRFNQAKIYVDGILSLGTAALNEPYLDDMCLPPGEDRGFEYFKDYSTGKSTLNEVAAILGDNGFQLHFHVVGDRAAGLALDAISGSGVIPHRLTHLYLVDENDRDRFAAANVVADFQLSPSSLDPLYSQFMEGVIGPTRAENLLPATELYNAGAIVTISSDWDADVLSPLTKMKTVLTRSDGRSLPDLETAIEMMTLSPAKLLQHADLTGSISIGKYADLVIIDRDIFEVPVDQIDRASIEATLLQGEPVYDPQDIFVDPLSRFPSSRGNMKLIIGVRYIFCVVLYLVFAST